jgi:protein-S-isoprenylcysteine O-methyltransferase Ste14
MPVSTVFMMGRIRIEDDAVVKALDNSRMSHRTTDLPQLRGFAHLIRELRYNEVARQSLAVILILVFALTSRATPLTAAVGMSLALVGTVVRLYASGFILKNKELAQNGPYALVRHPLYTGNILLVVGFAIAGQPLWAVPVSILFFWFYYPPAIEYEDRKLKGIFGQAWVDWSARTPALMPRFANAGAMGGGRWTIFNSLRKNGEILITIFVAFCAWRVLAPLAG